ncbi:MAG: hypothetical protein M3P98_03030 [bacterium]|nr:hypothetical protein [bacterium]
MNKLEHLKEFQEALKNYIVSERTKKILDDTKLVLLLAPSSTGRNTVIKNLLKDPKYMFIVSDTTRNPRNNDGVMEEDGKDYFFRTEKDFLNELKQGSFLEAEIIHKQQVSGISIRELEVASKKNKIAITDVDIGGVEAIVKQKPDTIVILLLPPDFEEWQKRVVIRGAMDKDEWKRRMETAVNILSSIDETKPQYEIVVNDDLREAIEYCKNIIEHGMTNPSKQTVGYTIARDLLVKTKKKLGK